MGTRSVIAEPFGDGFRGRYHHWDGYPSGLGHQLWDLYHGHFAGDVEAMTTYLIAEEPVGWSTINGADFDQPKGWVESGTSDTPHGPQSYSCRGETSDEPDGYYIHSDGDDGGTEWAYVLGARSLFIFERRFGLPHDDQGHGVGMFGLGASNTEEGGYWAPVAELPWEKDEPDWEKLNEGSPLVVNA